MEISEFVDRVKEFRRVALDRIPEPLSSHIEEEFETLEEMIMKQRPPRFAIVGRRGAGKSSLINAIFGSPVAAVGAVCSQTQQGRWYAYESSEGSLEILDTRGLGEGSHGFDSSFSEDPETTLRDSLSEKCPDCLLFLCKAKEVAARIDEDIASLQRIRMFVKDLHSYQVSVVGVVTQVDELDPVDVTTSPFNDDEKQANISAAQLRLNGVLSASVIDTVDVFAVCAYMRFEGNEIIHDRRWNIDRLIEDLVDRIPNSAQIRLARLAKVRAAQAKAARAVVTSTASLAGAVGVVPIPFADLPILTSMQTGMVTTIGYIAGRELDLKAVAEFLSGLGVSIGVGTAMREIARGLAKWLFPGGGSVISGAVAAATTYAIGEAAIQYFIVGKNLDQAKHAFDQERKKWSEEQE